MKGNKGKNNNNIEQQQQNRDDKNYERAIQTI